MQTYALFEKSYNPRLMLNFEKIAEVDINGKIGGSTCLNNPDARNFLSAMVTDWVSSNDLDGLMWESERQGPLNNTIGAALRPVHSEIHSSIVSVPTACKKERSAELTCHAPAPDISRLMLG